MKHIIPFLIAAVIIASCNSGQDSLNKDITVAVSVQEIQPKSINKYVSITGTIKPVKDVQLKSEMTGSYKLQTNPATGRPYALNDNVHEGDVIIMLEDKEYENNIKLSSLKLSLESSKQLYDKQQSLNEKGGATLNDVKTAEISYVNAKYSYDGALLQLQKMRVKAPFTGTIVDLPYYTPGNRLNSGTIMVSIMDYSKLYMDVNLAEKNMGTIKPGQQVLVTNYTLPGDTLEGAVTQLSPAIDADTRSFKGTITVNNPQLKLRPGMYVKGEIVVAAANKSVVVPKNIITSRQQGNFVFVVEKGIAYERLVQFGIENTADVQIVSGLKLGDQLVVKGFETLRNGSKVKVVK
jgi:membrane fusion protein, multidrug efflux system